jgi:hypothetical protein
VISETVLNVMTGSKDGKLEGEQGEGSSGVPVTSAKKTAVGGHAKDSLDSQGTANAEGRLYNLLVPPLVAIMCVRVTLKNGPQPSAIYLLK